MSSKLFLPKSYNVNLYVLPDKNPMWSNYTPNEEWRDNMQYRKFVERWRKLNAIPGHTKFLEKRIIKTKGDIEIPGANRWWEDSLFMEKIFWVFHKPIYATVDGQMVSFHALEPYECFRVVAAGEMKYGKNMFGTEHPPLILPTELLGSCFDEFAGGKNEHIRERPVEEKSQKRIDFESKRSEDAKKIMEKSKDIEASLAWRQKLDETQSKIEDMSKDDS